MRSHVVVVLSYFGRQDTIECIDSIRAGDPDVHPLVVDNGSADGVIEAAGSRWGDWVSTLELETNTGFTGGMNSGLRWALAHGAETITILNNDTVCRVGALSRLEQTARSGAAVAPEIRYATTPDRVWFAGGTIDPQTGLARHLRDSELAPPGPDGLRPTDALTGCCITARASVWKRVGLLDERFFLNFEDSDWSVRARQVEVALLVDTAAIIEHRVSASFTGAFSYLGLYFYARNGVTFVRERSDVGRLAAPRFIRRYLVPTVRPRPETGGARAAARRMVVLAYAARDLVARRYGPAPSSLERRATKWAQWDDTAESR